MTASRDAMKGVDLATIYENAATWLEEHGWCQGAMSQRRGLRYTACCISGAIFLTTDGKPDPFDASKAGRDAIEFLSRLITTKTGTSMMPSEWNDRHNRTKAEAVAMLRSAASAARAVSP